MSRRRHVSLARRPLSHRLGQSPRRPPPPSSLHSQPVLNNRRRQLSQRGASPPSVRASPRIAVLLSRSLALSLSLSHSRSRSLLLAPAPSPSSLAPAPALAPALALPRSPSLSPSLFLSPSLVSSSLVRYRLLPPLQRRRNADTRTDATPVARVLTADARNKANRVQAARWNLHAP